MARPSKGDRAAHMVKADPAVTRRLVRKAANAGVSSASQYIADVLALHVGLPDHVLELNQMAIVTKRKLPQLKGDPWGRIMVRPHRDVDELLAVLAAEHGFDRIPAYLEVVLAEHAGLPELARKPAGEEVLQLAM